VLSAVPAGTEAGVAQVMVGVVFVGMGVLDELEPHAVMQIDRTNKADKMEIFSTVKPDSFIEIAFHYAVSHSFFRRISAREEPFEAIHHPCSLEAKHMERDRKDFTLFPIGVK
jgi:hypothetical protein